MSHWEIWKFFIGMHGVTCLLVICLYLPVQMNRYMLYFYNDQWLHIWSTCHASDSCGVTVWCLLWLLQKQNKSSEAKTLRHRTMRCFGLLNSFELNPKIISNINCKPQNQYLLICVNNMIGKRYKKSIAYFTTNSCVGWWHGALCCSVVCWRQIDGHQ